MDVGRYARQRHPNKGYRRRTVGVDEGPAHRKSRPLVAHAGTTAKAKGKAKGREAEGGEEAG